MRLCIPYPTEGWGGPVTFVRTFSAWLEAHGHAVVSDPRKPHDVLFAIERCPLWIPRRARRMKTPLVVRLDGVYHPSIPGWNGLLYPLKNYRPRRLQAMADHVVYQSEFSRQACRRYLGKHRGPESLIYNGVAVPDRFPGKLTYDGKRPLQLVAAASFRRPDQLVPIFKLCEYLERPHQLHIIGPITEQLTPVVAPYLTDERVTYHGPMDHETLQRKLPTFDVSLFSDLSACPHSVLEALAAGLPVVGYDRGSLRELVRSGVSGEVVPLPRHDQFLIRDPFSDASYERAAVAVERVADSLDAYQRDAWQDARGRFDFDTMAEQYVALFEHLV